MTTVAFSLRSQLGFPLLKEKQMAVGEELESIDHLVAAFPTRSNRDRLQDLPRPKLPLVSLQSFPAS